MSKAHTDNHMTWNVKSNHNQFRHRMRRRYCFHPWLLLMTVLSLICATVPFFAMTAWLRRDHGWADVSILFNGLWLAGTIVMIVMIWAGFKAGKKLGSKARPIYWMLTITGACLGAVSLLFSRTDLAVASLYGFGAIAQIASLANERQTTHKPLFLAIANLALVAAIFTKSLEFVAIAFATRMVIEFVPYFLRSVGVPRKRPAELIAGKMSRAEYVRKAMEGCAVGGG